MVCMEQLSLCPVEVTLSLIDDRWKVLIVRELMNGTKRFGEIRKDVGNISTKVLTANLRSMEESGLLTRKAYAEVPPRVEYTLTECGYSLKSVLDAMAQWGLQYKQGKEGDVAVETKDGSVVRITRAEKKDAPEILELQYLAFQSEADLLGIPDIPPLKQTIEELDKEFEKSVFLKAVDEDGRIVGSVRACPKAEVLHIGKLMVHPLLQGQGIGYQLLTEIEHMLPYQRYELFTSTASVKNQQLYKKAGYTVQYEEESGGGIRLVYMAKEQSMMTL